MRRLIFLAGVALVLGFLFWVGLPKPALLDGVSFSREVFDRNGQLLAVTLSDDGKYRLYTPLKDIAPELVAATVRREDRWFENHPGVNPLALARSLVRFAATRERRLGASTITMQLARLRQGLHTRTAMGKLRQVFLAIAIERHYTKAEILEAYLNLAPYGGNLEGVGAASLAIFRKSPSALSRYEALALSSIPQSPARRAPLRNRVNPDLQAAMARREGPEAAEFRVVWRGMPATQAPHYARRILRERTGQIVLATLDGRLQQLVESEVRTYLRDRRRLDLRNAAVELYDWQKGEVLAHLGSADFFDASIHGQVDGVLARRSPGSTLKPFVYALAIQQGLIHPASIVLDAPRSFGGYNPENSDREFAGPLHAAEALARSRNVPAVELAHKLRRPGFGEFLESAGVALPKSPASYGLSLPLGGAEVSMDRIVRLYAMLANDGLLDGRRVLAPEAAFLTLEMLGSVPPPDGYGVRVPVYWKTGTSHGYHDAWAVGVCGPYVLAVWVGNFDGRANPALMGRTAAAPLFFQILESLESSGRLPAIAHRPPPGANLRDVDLCRESGALPQECCPHLVRGRFIPGVSPIAVCAVHREVLVDQASGLRVRADDGSRPVRREVFEFWPQEIQKLFARAGLPRRQPPPFLPGVLDAPAGNGSLRILSPRAGAVYSRRPDDSGELALQVAGDAGTRRVFWFDGAEFLGAGPASGVLRWRPAAGAHQLTVIDQDGRRAASAIRVEVLGAEG